MNAQIKNNAHTPPQKRANDTTVRIDGMLEVVEYNVQRPTKFVSWPKYETFIADQKLADKAFEDQCTGANPRLPLVKELEDIYIRAYND